MKRWLALGVIVLAGCGGASSPGGDAAGGVDGAVADASGDAPAANAALAALTASMGVLDPPFEPDVTGYQLDLVLGEGEVSFTATAAVPAGTTITVDGVVVGS